MNDSPWQYDPSYTMDLIHNTSGFFDNTTPNSIVSVDVIQVYLIKDKKNNILPLNRLRQSQLVGELRNKEGIEKFLRSIQIVVDHIEGCSLSDANLVFHIVMFDSKLMRVGYLRYYYCHVNVSICGVIRPLGDEGLFYNADLPAFLLQVGEKIQTSKYNK